LFVYFCHNGSCYTLIEPGLNSKNSYTIKVFPVPRSDGKIAKQRKSSPNQVAAAEVSPEGEATLSDLAYTQIEELIATLRLAPGQAISEASLGKMIGIGRTPIREALQRLARERLVVILPRRGVVISEINIRNQLKLLEMRRELERLIARTAARRATAEERKHFQEIADTMEKAAKKNDDTLFMRMDREFNLLSSVAARNDFLSDAIQQLQGLARRFWYMHYKEVADMPLAAMLHAAVARAIAAGDEKAAMQSSDNLIDYIETFTKATLMA